MLSRINKISKEQFSLFDRDIDKFASPIFFLKTKKFSGKGPRFAVSISKKISKSAVLRNKFRRLAMKVLQKHLDEIKSHTLVWLSYKEIPKETNKIEEDILNLFKKSKIIQIK